MLGNGFSRRALVKSLAILNLVTLGNGPAPATEDSRPRWRRLISRPGRKPLVEESEGVIGGEESNVGDILVTIIEPGATVPVSGSYWNEIDLTPRYTFLRNRAGFNISTTSNAGRSGIAANRVRAIQEGQGDLYAFNASVTVSSARAGAQHWLSNPAGVLFGGTVTGAVEGAYLNPFEVVLSDRPGETAFSCTGVGAVYNLSRNAAGGQLGQVWAGIRIQSVGAEPVDNMISGTGQFAVGLDLSMPSLDFGQDRAAIALKAGDRIHFNASATEQRNGNRMVRGNWTSAPGAHDYCEYDTTSQQWRLVLSGKRALLVSHECTQVPRLTFEGGVQLSGKPVAGWRRMNGKEDREAMLDTANITLEQLARRVKAIETALHQAGGHNGFLSI